jgi:hypothetical protein
MKTKVSVKLVFETDNGETSYRVQVWSIIKPKLSAYSDISINEKNLPYKIMSMAGMIAENFCMKYRDTLDPDAVARAAYEAYVDLQLDLRKQGIA